MTEQQITAEVVFPLLWLCIYLSIVLFGKNSAKFSAFRASMLKGFKAPLFITLLYYFSYFLGTLNPRVLLNLPGAVTIFCLSSLGLTMAQSINGFEPLPVTAGIAKREKAVSKVLLAVLFSLLIMVINFIVGQVGFDLCLSLFHESDKTTQAVQMLPGANKYLSFFVLLSGAGLMEEGMFRLFLLTFFWKVIKKPWAAVVLSSLCFGLYHLTPLNQMYQVYWQFPIAQVVSVFLAGLVLGFFYVKRGFETSVLGHTLTDWVGIVFFMK